jgi:hypothetical protein
MNLEHRWVAILAAALLMLCCMGIANAQAAPPACGKVADDKAHVCWAAPATYTNGTAIAAGTVITYTVQRQSGATWVNDATNITATDWISPVLQPGTYLYRVTATVGTKTSLPSGSAPRAVEAPTPEAPIIIVAVTIREGQAPSMRVVYTVRPRPGEVVFVAPASLRPYVVAR